MSVEELKKLEFPVLDSILYSNMEYFGIPIEMKQKPDLKEKEIPSALLGKIIKIWDFIINLKETLKIQYFTINDLYNSLVKYKNK